MRNILIRKKIGSVGGFLEKNIADLLPISLLFICYVLGFLIGYSAVSGWDPASISNKAELFISLPFKQLYPSLAAVYTAVSIMVVLSGFSVFGFISAPVVVAVFASCCGACIRLSQVLYSGKTAILMNAAIVPVISFFCAILIQYGKSAVILSYCIFRSFQGDKAVLPRKPAIRSYLAAAPVVLFSAAALSLLQYFLIRLASAAV